MDKEAQARQALKAALNGQHYNVGKRHDDNAGPIWASAAHHTGDVLLSKEAARRIDQLPTRVPYQGELEKAKRGET